MAWENLQWLSARAEGRWENPQRPSAHQFINYLLFIIKNSLIISFGWFIICANECSRCFFTK
jgi:hypothetical protein